MLNKNSGIQQAWPFAVLMMLMTSVGLTDVFRNMAMYGLIHADAQGYYGYLVAIFLEGSFDWEQVMDGYRNTYFGGGGSDFTRITEYGRVNKYYAGTAVLVLPFFLLACAVAWIMGFPVDGYAPPFHAVMMVGALFYAGWGLYLLARFLQRKEIPWIIGLLVGITCYLASGLFHYSVSEPVMSHVYSFFLFAAFMYTVSVALEKSNLRNVLLAAMVFGLIVLVRPSNGLVLLSVPFIAGGFGSLFSRLRQMERLWQLLGVAVIAVTAVVSIQALLYQLQVGRPVVWAYSGESFDFTDPKFLQVLFSYRKGFFVYTPWAFLGALGMVVLLFKRTAEAVALWFFLTVVVYVVSSWWSWYYGSSFGHRAMMEYLPFFGYGLGYLIKVAYRPVRAVLILLMLLFIPLNLVQSYQYNKFILHWDQMNRERYWRIFLRTAKKYDGIFYREPEVFEVPDESEVAFRSVWDTDLEELKDWGAQGRTQERAFSGVFASRIGKHAPYGPTIGIPLPDTLDRSRTVLLLTLQVWSEKALPDLSWGMSYRNTEDDHGHTYVPLGGQILEEKTWTTVRKRMPLPVSDRPADRLIAYPLSHEESALFVDDIRLEMVEVSGEN